MAKTTSSKIVGQKTQFPHIELIDIDDTGLLKEVAVVKREEDGALHYINVTELAPIDKQRLKKIISSPHADKYELWELLSQATLSNGLNALDFFHYNFVKVKRPLGARAGGLSIADVAEASTKIVGSEFVNPAEVALDQATKQFVQ